MAKGLSELRQVAKGMRIPGSLIRSASTAAQLQDLIDTHGKGKASTQKGNSMAPAKKKKGKAAPTKKSAAVPAKKSKTAPAKKSTATKPKASKKKGDKIALSVAKKSAAKKKKGNSAKPVASKKLKASTSTNGDAGKFTLSKNIDWSLGAEEGWNPRDGSPPDRIIKAVKKAKGNRSKAFEALKDDVFEFVPRRNSKGEKVNKTDAYSRLKYRISRIMWQYALKTEQHKTSDNRAEYGTAGTGSGTFKRGKRKKATQSTATGTNRRKAAASKGGRGRAAQARRKAATPGKKKAGRKKAGSRK